MKLSVSVFSILSVILFVLGVSSMSVPPCEECSTCSGLRLVFDKSCVDCGHSAALHSNSSETPIHVNTHQRQFGRSIVQIPVTLHNIQKSVYVCIEPERKQFSNFGQCVEELATPGSDTSARIREERYNGLLDVATLFSESLSDGVPSALAIEVVRSHFPNESISNNHRDMSSILACFPVVLVPRYVDGIWSSLFLRREALGSNVVIWAQSLIGMTYRVFEEDHGLPITGIRHAQHAFAESRKLCGENEELQRFLVSDKVATYSPYFVKKFLGVHHDVVENAMRQRLTALSDLANLEFEALCEVLGPEDIETKILIDMPHERLSEIDNLAKKFRRDHLRSISAFKKRNGKHKTPLHQRFPEMDKAIVSFVVNNGGIFKQYNNPTEKVTFLGRKKVILDVVLYLNKLTSR
eukprot:108655_1